MFLISYFRTFRAKAEEIIFHAVLMCIIATVLTRIHTGAATFFVYAAACAGLTLNLRIGIALIILVCSWATFNFWYFELPNHYLIPGVGFAAIIGFTSIFSATIVRKNQEIHLSQSEIKYLAAKAERERIARDLHDLMGHTLSSITLKAELARKLIDKDIEKAKKEIQDLENISRDTLTSVREAVTGYRTGELTELIKMTQSTLESAGIDFDYSLDFSEIPAEYNAILPFIIKELTTNLIRHSNAHTCSLTLTQGENDLHFSFNDDGKIDSITEGNGIKGIRERVEQAGGEFLYNIESGFHSEINLPLNKNMSEHPIQEK